MTQTLSIREAAARAGITAEEMVELLHRGGVRAVPDHQGAPVVDMASLEAWLAQTTPAPQP